MVVVLFLRESDEGVWPFPLPLPPTAVVVLPLLLLLMMRLDTKDGEEPVFVLKEEFKKSTRKLRLWCFEVNAGSRPNDKCQDDNHEEMDKDT